jgi:hypothetical protein
MVGRYALYRSASRFGGRETTLDQKSELAMKLIQKANNQNLPEFDRTALNQALTALNDNPVALITLPILTNFIYTKHLNCTY